jgi:hypothetical protein
MVQADLQAAMDVSVLTVRPVFEDVLEYATKKKLRPKQHLQAKEDNFAALIQFQQLSGIDSKHGLHSMIEWLGVEDSADSHEDARRLLHSQDIAVGICPLPLYEFTSAELECLRLGSDTDRILATLVHRGIAQFFDPPIDQLVLGLVDREIHNPLDISSVIASAPTAGHPVAAPEIVDAKTSLSEILEALSDKKLISEGEVSFELTPAGRSLRSTVRFKPRESVLSKLLNRFSVSLNLRDLFR